MIHTIQFWLTLCSALGCGLIAGVFFAFSSFVMPALARLPSAQGIAAMQSINAVVLNPVFLGAFMGTAALCAGLGLTTLGTLPKPGSLWMLVGSALYLFGTLLVTVVLHIPKNDALALVDPTAATAAAAWENYVASWTAWNHVRTAAALAAAATLTTGLWLARVP